MWTAGGSLLGQVTFTGESTAGWEQANFSSAIPVTAGTTYVASYFAPDGDYAFTTSGLASAVANGPLTALAGGGVYSYGSSPGFPSSTYDDSNFWVNVVFQPAAGSPPTVVSATPVAGSSSNPVSTDPTATFSEAVVPSTASFTVTGPGGSSVSGATSFNSADTVATFTPSGALAAGTSYTVTISGAQNSSGQAMSSSYSYSFTTSQAFDSGGQCPCTIWPDVAPSGASDANDTSANNIGVQFTAAQNGTVSGVRFYKEPDDTGTHTGSLWTSTGTLLATGTFTNESSQGWEELDFSTPVPVTAGTTYVASYHTNSGHYAYTSGGLSSAVTNGPLTALANGGVYSYGSSNAFPDSTYDDSNFWVNVVYEPTGPTVTGTNPISGQTSVPPGTSVSFTFNEAVQSSTIQFTLTGPGGASVPGSVSYDSSTDTATFIPTSTLTGGAGLSSDTAYTATVSGAEKLGGDGDERFLHLELHDRSADAAGGPVSVLDLAGLHAAVGDLGGRPEPEQPRRAVHGGRERIYHRDPVLQGSGQHRYSRRQLVDRGRQPARPGDLHR